MHTVHANNSYQDSPKNLTVTDISAFLKYLTGKSSPFSTSIVAIPMPLITDIKKCSIILNIYPSDTGNCASIF